MMFRLALVLLLAAPSAFAQLGGFGSAEDALPKVVLDGAVHQRDGLTVEGVVHAKVAAGWHINSARPIDEYAIATVLSLDESTATLVNAAYPQHKLQSFSFSQDRQIAVYDGDVQIPFSATLKQGASTVTAKLLYQACNDSVCLPPKTATANFSATPTGAPPVPAEGFIPLSEAPKNYTPEPQDRLAKTFASSGLPLTLGLLFLGGLALNLTPCVFPLIPITLGFFAMQSDGRRSRRFGLSAMYVLGIVIMYSALGVLAALGGKMFGGWLQLPAVLIGFAVMMLVLASSMFGAFEIQPPRWIANQSQGRAGLVGALSMGLVIGIVAAPCVGPVVISLLTLVASIGKPVIGGVMFAALAFGLGFPYLVLLNTLPRPGEWMVQVKKAMGFVLVAMAFYFLRPLTGDVVFQWGVALSLLIGAAFLFMSKGTAGRVMRMACASLLLVAGVAFAIPRSTEAGVQWTPYSESALSSGKLTVIDFYADWCLPCKELDVKTFTDPRVIAAMEPMTRVKADLTLANNAENQALAQKFGIIGVPAVIFLDERGQEIRELRLNAFEGPDKFLDRLTKLNR